MLSKRLLLIGMLECNISHSNKNKKLSSGAGSDKLGDLIILGLSYKATESDVKEYFEGYGEIKSCEVGYPVIFLLSRAKSRGLLRDDTRKKRRL